MRRLPALAVSRPNACARLCERPACTRRRTSWPHMIVSMGETSLPCAPWSRGRRSARLYEFILAADKPQGLLVHGDGTGAETLTARVQGHLRRRGSLAVPQALQRLDVDTSGVVLFSKVEEFQGMLDTLVSGHADVSPAGRAGVCKTYLAVVCGSFGSPTCDCAEPIGRDRHDARRMRVSQTGQPALTHVRRVAIDEGGRSGQGGSGRGGGSHALLAVTLGTGRRHQIRVHLAHLGHPIVNDPLYGTAESPDGLMLHAYSESFIHRSRTNRWISWPDGPKGSARGLTSRSYEKKAAAGLEGRLGGIAGPAAQGGCQTSIRKGGNDRVGLGGFMLGRFTITRDSRWIGAVRDSSQRMEDPRWRLSSSRAGIIMPQNVQRRETRMG